MKKILALAVNKFEDIELLGFVDVVKRHGVLFDIAFGVDTEFVTSQIGHEIKVKKTFKDVMDKLDEYDGVFLPGGSGFDDLAKAEGIENILKHFVDNNKVVGAICAAPIILAKFGFLQGKNAIVHPGEDLKQLLIDNGAILANYEAPKGIGASWEVVIDGNIITGLSMRTTIKYADEYVKLLRNK